MKLSLMNIGLAVSLSVCVSVQAEEAPPLSTGPEEAAVEQIIVQIGGRFCEYHRDEVEGALRSYPVVRQVEFLNNHGTVLVRYHAGAVPPGQLAESVERALASGIGCRVWVDRGGSPQAKS